MKERIDRKDVQIVSSTCSRDLILYGVPFKIILFLFMRNDRKKKKEEKDNVPGLIKTEIETRKKRRYRKSIKWKRYYEPDQFKSKYFCETF